MAHAETKEKATGIRDIQPGDSVGEFLGRRLPDTDDPTGHDNPPSGAQEALEVRRQARIETPGGPQSSIAQGFEFRGNVA
jgi:hypothetical protein